MNKTESEVTKEVGIEKWEELGESKIYFNKSKDGVTLKGEKFGEVWFSNELIICLKEKLE